MAQKAATIQILSGNRFRLGLGAGENLNEHVVGKGWPSVGVRHRMLTEAVEIIGALFDGGGETINYRGEHFDIETAKLWDLPERRVPIGVAVSGRDSCELAGRKADLMVAVEPKPEYGEMFDEAGGAGKPRVGQIALAYDPDRDAAIRRAHEQFRWFGLGWKVNADLPNPDSFDSATQFVTPEQVAEALSCGPDVEEHVEKNQAVPRGGLHRRCAGPDRGQRTRAVHRLGAARATARAALALTLRPFPVASRVLIGPFSAGSGEASRT